MTTTLITETEWLYTLALKLTPRVGDITAKTLISYCGSAENAFKESKRTLNLIPGIGHSIASSLSSGSTLKVAEKELSFTKKNGIDLIHFKDSQFPIRLNRCNDGPIFLFSKGVFDFNPSRTLAVVGTRNATNQGKKICRELVEGLSESNIQVISGLARGIDTVAHQSATSFNMETLAILAHGLDRIYPAENKKMANEMLEKGGWITDFFSGTKPDKENFPRRNRIVAGMADAILVIESKRFGGSMITAEIGNSYQRDVFAVPGRVNDTISEGCNFLIKTLKAGLIENASDLCYQMQWDQSSKCQWTQKKLFVGLSKEEELIYNALEKNSVLQLDDICQLLNSSVSILSMHLLNLELQGIISSLPGKKYRLT